MKKLALLLMFIPVCANALCLTSYLDEDGQSHTIKCGSDTPEEKCGRMVQDRTVERVYMNGGMYWNGESCQKVKVIEICENQGGEWVGVSLLKDPPRSVNTCACPDGKVWDGKECRTDVPVSKQCVGKFSFVDDPYNSFGFVRMTEEFYGSKNCARICSENEVWDGEECRADVPVSKQCVGKFSLPSDPDSNFGYIRVTERIYGSNKCLRVFQMK